MKTTTDFGFKQVKTKQKQNLVRDIFDSVADNYDLMNDVLSLGIHRLWKDYALAHSGLQRGDKVLDIAGGSGDMAKRFVKKVGKDGQVVLTDINYAMLTKGREKMLNNGLSHIKYVQLSAEALSFGNRSFDCVCIAFGLRNMTDKNKALSEAYRVLKVGGRLLVLEFSKVENWLVNKVYEAYSFNIMPKLGGLIAGDERSYQYLAESIDKHPNQQSLEQMFKDAGFSLCEYHNLTCGIVALHKGIKQ